MKVNLWEEGEIIKYLVFGDLEFFIRCIALKEDFYTGYYRNDTWYSEKNIFTQSKDKETEEITVVYIGRKGL